MTTPTIAATAVAAAATDEPQYACLSGAFFEARHSYSAVIAGCMALSALATWAVWQLVRQAQPQPGL